MKHYKNEVISVLVLLTISSFTWLHIPSLQFQAEGFIYFLPSISSFYTNLPPPFDLFAKIVFNILPPIFKGQVSLYMWFLFVWMILTDIAYYLMVRVLSRNNYVAILASFFFGLSYVGKFDMFSTGGYQYFVQRGAILLPQLIALLFFGLYFYSDFKHLYYFISLVLFDISIIMGFFGSWFLPPFLIFPILHILFSLENFKKFIWKIICVPLPFLITNLLIIRQSGFIPEESIFLYVFQNFILVVKGILQQLVVVTPPLGELLKIFNKGTTQFELILGFTLTVYCLAYAYIYKVQKNLRVLSATAVLSLLAILLLNVYLNAANVLNTLGSSRYFYFPFAMVALFWGLFFYSVASKGRFNFILVLIFCCTWLVYNVYHIKENLVADAWIHRANSEAIKYVEKVEANHRKGTFVYLPGSLGGWGQEFISRFYGKSGIKFAMEGYEPLDLKKLIDEEINPDYVYILHYDPKKQKVVDLSRETREKMRRLEKLR